MATAKAAAIQKPLIQIDDEVREMTDQEYAVYEAEIANAIVYPPVTEA